jgi:glycosyltransferase involved in cell wall biosynthesis
MVPSATPVRHAIAIDARKLGETGIGRYAQHLLSAVEKSPDAHGYRWRAYSHADRWVHAAGMPVGTIRETVWSGGYGPLQHAEFAARMARHPADLFHGTHFTIPLLIPGRTRVITTIHDVAFFRRPELARRSAGMALRLRAYRLLVRLSARRADVVCAVTQAAADEMVMDVPEARGKIRILPNATDMVPFDRLASDPAPDAIVLVGMISARKGVADLVRAYAQGDPALRSRKLVLVGPGHEDYVANIRRIASELGVADCLTITGAISDAELMNWYRQAAVVVLPSHLEGFGLPILEAMAMGIPTVASTLPAIREVTDGASVLVPPGDIAQLADALSRLCADPGLRRDLIGRGLVRAEHYRVNRLGERAMTIYRELLGT